MTIIWFALGAIVVTLALCICAALIVGTWTELVRHARGDR